MRHASFAARLLLIAALFFLQSAHAGWLADNQADGSDFLPVDEAFRVSAWRDADTLYVGFTPAEGYYLYRQRFAATGNTPGASLGAPQLPPGTFKSDPYLGDVHVFHDPVVMRVPIKGDVADDQPLSARITFQGCAEAGLCYPPETLSLTARPGSPPERFATADGLADTSSNAPRAASTDSVGDPSTTPALPASAKASIPAADAPDSAFSALLDNDVPAWLVLTGFFLAGLGLTFTPCVLPMMPILAAIIVGQRSGHRRALLLSGSYVAGMAATYAIVGVLMGLFGAGLNLQARLQSPWVLIPFALLFTLFALAMLDTVNLSLPSRLGQRVSAWQTRLQRSGPAGLALAGALSVVVVSPCVSAPLAGALVYIAATGEALWGGAALLALALGMGVPLLLVGTFGGALLPRAGAWMNGIKSAFGVLMLGIAIWLVERLLPGPVTLLLWAALAMGTALMLGALSPGLGAGWPRLRQTLGLLLLGWGLALVLGAAQGGNDPLRPLRLGSTDDTRAAAPTFTTVTTLEGLQRELARAARRGQPAFVDISAEWCIACRIMEHEVFPAPAVARRLADFHRIRADVTDTDATSRALLDHFGLFGPPGLLFFAGNRELKVSRLLGEVDAETLARHLDDVLNQVDAAPATSR
ncbi:protein-disulfide reductase DsbD [Modicisalibacter tunisiensis]|uniref:Protein-disulfide reductase DsbD n=1 Tax=Modicisalibacter tunisiensis TaxID=390637 RepID=A0ABS7X1Y1_9GAMM|nr:protein-disulfide reductase DsbD [Modicisalibacter tunisiensis]MBZ9568907.1 protein-disulfide reductase DsbD [Modicisalibacter tunisiensis]